MNTKITFNQKTYYTNLNLINCVFKNVVIIHFNARNILIYFDYSNFIL